MVVVMAPKPVDLGVLKTGLWRSYFSFSFIVSPELADEVNHGSFFVCCSFNNDNHNNNNGHFRKRPFCPELTALYRYIQHLRNTMRKQQSHLITCNLLTKHTHTHTHSISQSVLYLYVGKRWVLSADLKEETD